MVACRSMVARKENDRPPLNDFADRHRPSRRVRDESTIIDRLVVRTPWLRLEQLMETFEPMNWTNLLKKVGVPTIIAGIFQLPARCEDSDHDQVQ